MATLGLCNPEDEEAVQRDTRTPSQRNHDGLNAALRALLTSGKLGRHNGLPATIIVTTTLKDLEAAAGKGLTGGGTLLPMSDVIRLARHYLAVFDKGKVLALYHSKRLATRGNELCSTPRTAAALAPAATCPATGAGSIMSRLGPAPTAPTSTLLTLACGSDHALVEPGGWTTHKRANGDTEWIPPPHLDYGRPRTNAFHHPEDVLAEDDP